MTQDSTNLFLEIALPVPMRRSFEYLLPAGWQAPKSGCRVKVPFGKQEKIGVVMALNSSSEWPTEKLKPIIELVDISPVLDDGLLALLRWASQYYHHAIGEVVQAALPVNLRKGDAANKVKLRYWRLHPELTDSDLADAKAALKRAAKQLALLEQLAAGDQSESQLLDVFSRQVIKSLSDKALISDYEQIPEPNLVWQQQLAVAPAPFANTEQALAISRLQNTKGFEVLLLEGVTGSGKTEVFLQGMEPSLKQGKQILILVPEISLTPQTTSRIEQRFGLKIDAWHSGLTDNERHLVWLRARNGEAAIVVGTRSAVFLPFKQLAMIIVDEEHDTSFKQQDGFRYHARDLAIVRAKALQVPLLLASATPSLESLNNALQGRYQHLILQTVAVPTPDTKKQLLDLNLEPSHAGLSDSLRSRILWHIQQNRQVLIFVNRRGYAPAILCNSCGHVQHCHQCSSPFTLHKSTQQWHCHHCGAVHKPKNHCQQCGHSSLETAGFGTEKVEEQLQRDFPHHNVVRIDSDAMRGKTALARSLEKIHSGHYHILVGTQILAKGHHFPNIAMVAVLDVDSALFSADFRATERLAQLITQVSGRTGRAGSQGEMWLQTRQPQHPLLQDLLHNGYAHFARTALGERNAAQLPPFYYQVLFRAEAVDAGECLQFLQQLKEMFHMEQSLAETVACIGPFPALVEKKQGRYRMQLLLNAVQRNQLHLAVQFLLTNIESMPFAKKVRWSVDVDPADFY